MLTKPVQIPESCYSIELWHFCVAHGITPHGTEIDEFNQVLNRQTRDFHPPQQLTHRINQEEVVQAVDVEYASTTHNGLTYIRPNPARFNHEGWMLTYQMQETTIVHEHGNLRLLQDGVEPPRTRVTLCGTTAGIKRGPMPEGFASAYKHWFITYGGFSESQFDYWWKWLNSTCDKEIASYGRFTACCEAVRWIKSQVRPLKDVRDFARILLEGVRAQEVLVPLNNPINDALRTANMMPIHIGWGGLPESVLWTASNLLQHVGSPSR